jgi:hypothetical protein
MRWDSIGGKSPTFIVPTRRAVARCGAETLSDRNAVLECPVPAPYSATHGIVRAIVRARAQKPALDGFLGYNDRLFDRDYFVYWDSRVTCIRLRRKESCECRCEVCAYL